MPRKPKFKDPDSAKLREDTAETAYRTLQEAVGERPKTVPGQPSEAKNPRAQKRGKKGGKKGGEARAKKLTPQERSEIGRQGAQRRWEGHDKPDQG